MSVVAPSMTSKRKKLDSEDSACQAQPYSDNAQEDIKLLKDEWAKENPRRKILKQLLKSTFESVL